MLKQIEILCQNCTLCRLGKALPVINGTQLDPHVFSNMNPSKYAIFGQNPGFNECIQKIPFVGDAGRNFDKEIIKHDINRELFYISNVVHCYTPKNRKPLPEELRACRPIIMMELLAINPKLIITLGKPAFETFCPEEHYGSSLGSVRFTKIIQNKFIPVFPIYHPSGMNLAIKQRRFKFEKDIKMLCDLIKKLDQTRD